MSTKFLQSLQSAQALLSNLKEKLQPLAVYSRENRVILAENKENLNNFCKNSAAEQMEILWLKSSIDALCADNALLFKEINEILRVLEAVGLKYKELKREKTRYFSEKAENRVVLLEKSLENEKVRIFFIIFQAFLQNRAKTADFCE